MSKHKIAKQALAELQARSVEISVDPNEAVEALLTWCIEDMKDKRGPDFARDYVRYELDSIGAGGMFEIQKR